MQKPTKEVFAQATALHKAGKPNKEIMGITGLSHSQLEMHIMRLHIAELGGYLAVPATVTAWGAQIARMREQGTSWGIIGVRYQVPESRVRKVFAEATGLRSQGMRIGQGGAYYAKNPMLYTGADRAKLGTELAVGANVAEVAANLPNTPEARKLPQFAAKGSEARTRAPRKPKAKPTT